MLQGALEVRLAVECIRRQDYNSATGAIAAVRWSSSASWEIVGWTHIQDHEHERAVIAVVVGEGEQFFQIIRSVFSGCPR